MLWAGEFKEIPQALRDNPQVRERLIHLVCGQRIPGKITEGGNRLDIIRTILCDLAEGRIGLDRAFSRAESELSEESSLHYGNRRVFCERWAERLVRTQFSRFYNQAVIQLLQDRGETQGFVPHSATEQADSQCSRMLAGRSHALTMLYQRLVESYEQGYWNDDPKIPDHPHCTHAVRPLFAMEPAFELERT